MGYVDETGFSATPDNRYAWTKIGDVHAVDAVRLKRVNVMGCLLSTGHLITRCLQESVNSRWFYAYLSDVLKRLPTHKVTQIEELLPHCWKPKSN